MKALHEKALVQLLGSISSIATAVGAAISWDDNEIDMVYPALTLRLVTTSIPQQLVESSGLMNPLVEISAHEEHSTAASELLDIVIAGLEAYRGRTSVVVPGSGTAVFGGISLSDVQQSPASVLGKYRKSAFYSIWLEG